ncbi:hypothetical protein GCM10010169_49380 [Micromonospora fulviviridis]|nr:hypothetical protein GCM10010169_49380 [Micromonospora fulviviridis]
MTEDPVRGKGREPPSQAGGQVTRRVSEMPAAFVGVLGETGTVEGVRTVGTPDVGVPEMLARDPDRRLRGIVDHAGDGGAARHLHRRPGQRGGRRLITRRLDPEAGHPLAVQARGRSATETAGRATPDFHRRRPPLGSPVVG